MAVISVYDINNFIKTHTNVTGFLNKEIEIFPTIGYADETAPFIVYFYSPSIPSVEAFWNRKDAVIYSIYDTDIDRLMNLGEILIDILSKGDEISQASGVAGTDVRILSTEVVSSFVEGPAERDGWYNMDIQFNVYNVKR